MDTVTITGNITLTRAQVEEAQRRLKGEAALPPDRAYFTQVNGVAFFTIPRRLAEEALAVSDNPFMQVQIERNGRIPAVPIMYSGLSTEVEMTPEEVRAYFARMR
jgi:hypothetical protein